MRITIRDHGVSRLLKEPRYAVLSSISTPKGYTGRRGLAIIKDLNDAVCFSGCAPRTSLQPGHDHKAPDERTLQLGKTVRELHERLPTLLQTPLPSEFLSPHITLHLFPSTHPHLPTVSGRIAYTTALWTSPVAWGRVPLIGNVKITILSERMVRHGNTVMPCGYGEEKLIVKWQTRGRGGHRDTTGGIYRDQKISARDPEDKIRSFLHGNRQPVVEHEAKDQDFCGIFIFEFDEHGRIRKHIIEHTEQGGYEDKMNKFVNVTDWLLGKFTGATKGEGIPALAFCEQSNSNRSRIRHR